MVVFARYPSLLDRVAIVTGGGSGIGAAIVTHLCAQGARVAFLDMNEEASRTLAVGIDPPPLFVPCDLRDVVSLRVAVARVVAELGPVRVLVNNAANDDRHRVDDLTPEYWRDRLAVNLDHHVFAAQAVHASMRDAGGGAIISLGSIAWRLGLDGLAGYVAAKAAISGLTKGLAREFGPDAIRVNAVLPGAIHTPRQLELWLSEADIERILEKQSLKEPLYPDDVARMVLFLAADDGRMCSGQEFIVDGGWV